MNTVDILGSLPPTQLNRLLDIYTAYCFKPDVRRWQVRAPGFYVLCRHLYVCVFACVSPPPRLLITSGVMWCDMGSIQLVQQVLQFSYGNRSYYH